MDYDDGLWAVVNSTSEFWPIKLCLVIIVILLNVGVSRFLTSNDKKGQTRSGQAVLLVTGKGEAAFGNFWCSDSNLVAHPDDEVMFFGPTIFNVRQDHDLHLLCLSTGMSMTLT